MGFSLLSPQLFHNVLEICPFKTAPFDNASTALRAFSVQSPIPTGNFTVYIQNHFQGSCPKAFLWVAVVTPEVQLDGNLSCSISLGQVQNGPRAPLGMHDLQCRNVEQNCCRTELLSSAGSCRAQAQNLKEFRNVTSNRCLLFNIIGWGFLQVLERTLLHELNHC